MIDRGTNRVVYSRGFASIYGEWETTGEAQGDATGRSPSRCAFRRPTAPVQVVLKKRDPRNAFREVWTLTVDPADKFVDRGAALARGRSLELEQQRRRRPRRSIC